MTPDQARHAIGARFMVGLRGARPDDPLLERDLSACLRSGITSVILFDRDMASGGPRNVESRTQVRQLCEHIQNQLGPNARIAVDQEGGRVARFKPEHGFTELPTAAEFALAPITEQRHLAAVMAQELAHTGVTLNFAPCVDLDAAGRCPVIGGLSRSFSDDPSTAARAAAVVIDALQNAGVSACVKHFPGHGPATRDSHAELPDITDGFDPRRDLAPYRELFAGPNPPHAVMTGHLLCRTIDPDLPASLSPAHTAMLRHGLGFRGLIVTDSIDMGALRQRHGLVGCARLALSAGADLVVHACNSPLGETAEDVAAAVEVLADEG